jgi:hypothetical protein
VFKRFLAGAALVVAGASPLLSCDLCAIYTSFAARELRTGWSVGLFDQSTDFGTVQQDGRETADPERQSLRSSISQVFVGYQWSRRFGAQVSLPWVDRAFRRVEGESVERGGETGLGDAVLLAHWQAVERVIGTSSWRISLLGGVKLPTGDSGRLAEELAEEHDPGDHHAEGLSASPRRHEDGEHGHGAASVVHAHDLALGSGSTDFLIGGALSATVGRAFLEANLQYALRRTGDFDYRFANDLQATLSGGAFLLLRHERSLALGAQLGAERKGRDRLAGETLDDTGVESLYAGPLVRYTHGDRWFGELALDLPVSIENTALQIVPDWRARLGVTHRF